MNVTLKVKLTISYVLLSLFLVSSLLFASNYLLEKKFQTYIVNTQEKKNQDIVHLVENEFNENGDFPSMDVLKNIGNTALSQGLIFMITDTGNKELFCMSTLDSQICDNMLDSMRSNMSRIYPNFKGQYVEKEYDVLKNNKKVATVTLGYYGPYFYNDEDVQFIEVLNKVVIGAGILFLILAVFLGFYMADRISGPVKRVIDKTRQIEEGDYSKRLNFVSKTTEMNQLIQSVNRLADSLEKQQSSKKQMARDYAHEFRTPLAALQSNLEAMIDGVLNPTEERLESCRIEILRLARMISDLDKLVEIENESLKLRKTKFDLSSAVKQVSFNFQQEISSKGIKLDLDLKPCELYADKDKIAQVIINLLTNAIKYTDNNGHIRIQVNRHKEEAELIVSDTGSGIGEEDLPHIFEHLYRTDKSRNRNTGGSGIGLSVVKAIVDAHGGNILVKSQLDRGSRFVVTLPLSC